MATETPTPPSVAATEAAPANAIICDISSAVRFTLPAVTEL